MDLGDILELGEKFIELAGMNRWLGPVLLIAAVVGMTVRAYQLLKNASKTEIDISRLQKIDLRPYLPWLKENLRGHDEIIEEIIRNLQQNCYLAKSGRTLGTFMLVGPTGTGKTFLAQLIAEALHPGIEPVILRMNQLKHPDDVFTLIGPPPGVKGFELGGALTRPVLENPYRVVILDELEKAHKDIHHCLYDMLDTAKCREKSSGDTVSFSACVFFATSNAGVEALRSLKEQGADAASWLGRSRDALSTAGPFDKAFLARWDGIYLLDELSALHVAEVACLKLAKRWREYGIELEYTDPALLLEAVQKNEEFREYGVRQLGSYLESKTNGAIAEARKAGVKKVSLEAGPSGELVVKPVEVS